MITRERAEELLDVAIDDYNIDVKLAVANIDPHKPLPRHKMAALHRAHIRVFKEFMNVISEVDVPN